MAEHSASHSLFQLAGGVGSLGAAAFCLLAYRRRARARAARNGGTYEALRDLESAGAEDLESSLESDEEGDAEAVAFAERVQEAERLHAEQLQQQRTPAAVDLLDFSASAAQAAATTTPLPTHGSATTSASWVVRRRPRCARTCAQENTTPPIPARSQAEMNAELAEFDALTTGVPGRERAEWADGMEAELQAQLGMQTPAAAARPS
jgi:hypothetical protein